MVKLTSVLIEDDPMAVATIEEHAKNSDLIESITSFTDPVEGFNYLTKNKTDVLFLDVEMPKMTGIELLEGLSNPPLVILQTAKEEYAYRAFELGVLDYLLKPVNFAAFQKSVTKAADAISSKPLVSYEDQKDYIFVKEDSIYRKIMFEEILYIEALGDYVKIITKDKTHVVYTTMKAIQEKLPENQFVRVHRSFIVRVDKIASLSEGNISIDQKIIPVGNTYKPQLKNMLNLL